MLERFVCPDGADVSIESCLSNGGCRMGNRCLSRCTLRMCASRREWNGTPSTTQLVCGTMYAYLQLTRPYAVNPASRAKMVLGSKVHAAMENMKDERTFCEERVVHNLGITGIADFLECEVIDGKETWTLGDYKTSGAYALSRKLGYSMQPVPTGEVYKSGKKKGQPKFRKERIYNADVQKDEMFDWTMQLNCYRMAIEDGGAMHIDRMIVEAICTDTRRSKLQYKLPSDVFIIDIERVPDDIVIDYFTRKRNNLIRALEQGVCDEPCNQHERWDDDMRCRYYCDVAQFCPYGKDLCVWAANEEDEEKEDDGNE